MKLSELNQFLRGYITAAFWTMDDDAPSGDYSTSGRPEELFAKLDESALLRMVRDCRKFQDEQAGQLRLAGLDDSKC